MHGLCGTPPFGSAPAREFGDALSHSSKIVHASRVDEFVSGRIPLTRGGPLKAAQAEIPALLFFRRGPLVRLYSEIPLRLAA